jgi:hypothetical protein
MPDSFATSSGNLLLIANGVDRVSRWDGLYPQVEPAGVTPPATAPTISATGVGSITGAYSAYVRFIDRRGNFSNFSPVSNAIVAASNQTINYTNVPVPQEAAVVRRQILRTTADQSLTYFVDIDTTDLGSTSFSSTRLDADLQVQEPQALFDANGNVLANAFGVPPDWKPFVVSHQGRMWLAGEQPYFEGAAIVTFGSKTVTGVGTDWKATFPGRFFYGAGSFGGIEIDSISGQTITLLSPWLGASDPYLYYKILPAPAEKNLLYFSGPASPEAWSATDALEIPEDGYAITGMMVVSSFLYILKELRIHRLTNQGDPVVDGVIFESVRRGCINNRCWVTEGMDAYLLDYYGCYLFRGGQAEAISVPINAIFTGTNRNYALNWQQSRYWHASIDSDYDIVRWFVTLGGDYLPRHALCYNTELKRWWIEEYPVPIGCSAVGNAVAQLGTFRSIGSQILYFGSRATKVYSMSAKIFLDAADPQAGTTRGTVASSGLCSLTCASAEFAAGVVGSTVYIVQGKGQGQGRLIASLSGTTLTLTQPWTILPDSTSVFQIGAVPWEYRTGRTTFADGEDRKTRKIQVGFRPTPSQQEAILELYEDYNETTPIVQQHQYTVAQRRGVATSVASAQQRIDLTRLYGTADVNIDAQRERDTDARRRVALLLYGWNREDPLTFKQIVETGVVGE